jgi:lipopolysaccharide/colanic/teichoic acid biosynthesis glycosyltransferase
MYPRIKRIFDFTASLLLIILFSVPMAIVALLIRIKLGSPVLFKQIRPGYKGQPFEMLKFRSMRVATDSSGNPLPDAQRMTAFGTALRQTSLDELPQLFNVLRGDMSLVGPRPLLMEYLPRYSAEQARRHDAMPGISGWAQINGRNAVSWKEKFEMDVWYVDHQSMWLDLKILLKTFGTVISKSGISTPGHVTTKPFMGTEEDNEPPQSQPLGGIPTRA